MKDGFDRRNFVVSLLGAGALLGGLGNLAMADQPHMHASLAHLRNAMKELEAALPDKGGHRAKAIELVKSAIAEVEEGIEFDRKH